MYALVISFLVSILVYFFIGLKIVSLILGYSILVAIAISIINFILAMFAFQYSYKKSNKTFLIVNIGGMGARIMLVLVSVLISIKFLKVDLVGFIFTLFIWYILLLIFEILVIKNSLAGR